jgi:hypothetical protein
VPTPALQGTYIKQKVVEKKMKIGPKTQHYFNSERLSYKKR